MLMVLWDRWRNNRKKKKQIRELARILPSHLKAKYGSRDYYSITQVNFVIDKSELTVNGRSIDRCFAYAMYCSSKEFYKAQDIAELGDYLEIRSEVSSIIFHSTSDFTFSSLAGSSNHGSNSSDGGYSDAGSDSGGSSD